MFLAVNSALWNKQQPLRESSLTDGETWNLCPKNRKLNNVWLGF